MFPKLWGIAGVDYPTLVDRLLQLALERHHYRIAPLVLDAADVLAIAKKRELSNHVGRSGKHIEADSRGVYKDWRAPTCHGANR